MGVVSVAVKLMIPLSVAVTVSIIVNYFSLECFSSFSIHPLIVRAVGVCRQGERATGESAEAAPGGCG